MLSYPPISCYKTDFKPLIYAQNTIRLSVDSLIVSAGFLIASADTIRIFTRGIDLWDRTRCLLINTTYLMIQEIVFSCFPYFAL